jgi:hypothetical protein
MSQAQSDATAAALTHLGYTVRRRTPAHWSSASPPGSPASHVLKVSQVITAVNGTPTVTPCSLVTRCTGSQPGHPGHALGGAVVDQRVGAFVTGPTVQRTITLGTPPKGLVDTGCGAAHQADGVPGHRHRSSWPGTSRSRCRCTPPTSAGRPPGWP